jgi:transposase
VTSVDQLPDDPALLKQMILQIRQEAAARVEALQQKHQAEIQALLRRFYGPRSERFDPAQLLLFGQAIDTLAVETQAVEQASGQKLTTRRVRGRHPHGRGKLPEALPRIPIEHQLDGDDLKCPGCGKERVCIGQEVTEQLEYYPASFKVLQHIQHKYACKDCDQNGNPPQIELAAKPPQPIEKGLAGPGLLAYVITSKLADHLPLYRLEKILARQDLHIASSTMCAWMGACAELVRPLYERMIQRVRQSQVIHTDDTRVPVQDAQVEGKCKSGRIWTYIGDTANPYVVYEYTPDRTRAGPATWLKEYQGYLQADAYGGYDGIYATGVIEVACWAHARRKFFDAQETDASRAAAMLGMIQELYAVEQEAKALKDEARRELRQQKAIPILAKIQAWLEQQSQLVLPRSPMAGAMQYALNQWQALKRYTEAGFLDIDNNAAERAMKRVAIGRKNWLFAGNDTFGQYHAVLWSLIASAEAHGIDPQRYLTSVLAKIAQTPLSELEQFLPEVWKREDQAESLTATEPSSTASASPQV